jgi:hypothetical protein
MAVCRVGGWLAAKDHSIEGIYADDQTGEPEWALVKTGLFGTRSTFVPIAQASQRNDDVQVPYGTPS